MFTEAEESAYFANPGDSDAAQIILARNYGGEILDRVIDRMIAQDEYFDFPQFIDGGCRVAFMKDDETESDGS